MLVAAINQANATSEPDTINLESGTYSFTEPDSTEPVNLTDGANALPSIKSNITINGVADTTNPTVIERPERALLFRIFRVAPAGTLTLNRLKERDVSRVLCEGLRR